MRLSKYIYNFLSTGLFLLVLPMVTKAAYFGDIDGFFVKINGFINKVLVPFIFTVALLVFIYGMVKFFILPDGDREKGKSLMFWAIIGFVLMISIWGIVNLLATGLFGVTTQPTRLPGLPTL